MCICPIIRFYQHLLSTCDFLIQVTVRLFLVIFVGHCKTLISDKMLHVINACVRYYHRAMSLDEVAGTLNVPLNARKTA